MAPTTTNPQPAAEDKPPPPLDVAQAGLGLTIPEIASRNAKSKVAIYQAVKRLAVEHLEFNRLRLYSVAQADFLLRNMRSPDSRSGKRESGSSCLPR